MLVLLKYRCEKKPIAKSNQFLGPNNMNYNTSQFKNGLKLILDGNPCSIVNNEIVKPGKGQAFNRVKFKDLITGKTLENIQIRRVS